MKHLFALLTVALMAVPAAASPLWFSATLTGASENPPTGSAGTGSVIVVYNSTTHLLDIGAIFSGLSGDTVASHIHCCTAAAMSGNAGVATEVPTFSLFPLGVTSGNFHEVYDLTNAASFNPAFVTAQGSVAAAEMALVAGMANGNAYFNIHTTTNPGGEIRGFLTPTPIPPDVPEPATVFLCASLIGLWWLRRKPA